MIGVGEQTGHLDQRPVDSGGEARRRGARRRSSGGGKQGFHARGCPGRGLARERVETALHDRQCAVVGGADPCGFVQSGVARRGIAAAGDSFYQSQCFAKLGHLPARIGSGCGGGEGRLMRHGVRG